MITYHYNLKMFEYKHFGGGNLFCYSFVDKVFKGFQPAALKEQVKNIYNIDVISLLN